jgi:hypothetical protein
MKTDYNSISFRNKDIDRLSGNTTKSPAQAVAALRDARNGNTPKDRADAAAKAAMKEARKMSNQ